MIKRRHQNETAILAILLVISACMGISNIPLGTLQPAQAALLGLSFDELSCIRVY
jgi:hypothetical protein